MAAKDPARRTEIARKAGKARAQQFSPAYQRWAGAHQSSAARSEAGHKGALATIARHGYPGLQAKIGAQYLTYVERRIVAVFNGWGWQREVDYWIDYRIDTDTTSYFVDVALKGRRYIEASSAWVAAQPKNVKRNARKDADLAALGWRGLWLTENDTNDPKILAGILALWLVANPPQPKTLTEPCDWGAEIPF